MTIDLSTNKNADTNLVSNDDSNNTATTFKSFGLSEAVLSAVEDMGYSVPTPVQAAAIPQALTGRDVLAAAQTGTGKTAAFLLPSINNLGHVPQTRGRGRAEAQGPLMLVVTPTRELAQQIETVCRAVCRRTGHTSVTVVGGVSYNPQRDKLRRGCDILIATPGRLEDLIEQGACKLDQVSVLVLDEADRMLDMGFLPAIRRIVKQTRDDRQTLLFSATLDEKQVGSITNLVHNPARIEIAPTTSTADTVDQYVLPVSMEAKNKLLTKVLKLEGASRAIVFTRTKHRADACARRLSRSGITAQAIHGDRSQAQRMRALDAFRAGKCDVLVATDVLARGIDISDVRYVINFDVPTDPVDYIHRIGRTGRAGEVGWALTFVTPEDVDEFYDIEALMGKTAEIFMREGLDMGAHPPVVDPERVPADAPAGKKKKKRRRKSAKPQSRQRPYDEQRDARESEPRAPRRRRKSAKPLVDEYRSRQRQSADRRRNQEGQQHTPKRRRQNSNRLKPQEAERRTPKRRPGDRGGRAQSR